MILKFEERASVILYNFLVEIPKKRTFLLPANVCPIVPAIYIKAGVSFEFIDINLETLEMNTGVILSKFNRNPKSYCGLHCVHTYGVYTNNEKLFKEIKNINSKLFIIDDRCLQKPEFIIADTKADLSLYSTGYSKYVDINWGGYGFLSNDMSFYKSNNLNYEQSKLDDLTFQFNESIRNQTPLEYKDTEWLGNTNFDKSFSIFKKEIMNRMPKVEKLKNEINNIYRNEIPNEAQFTDPFQYWRFNILVNKKEMLLKKIFSSGLFASSHYSPVTFMFRQKLAPNAQKLYDHVINLFNDFRFSPEKAEKVSKIVSSHVKHFGRVKSE